MKEDANPAAQRAELQAQRRRVDFDTYDITVDELLRRIAKGRIDVAPAYQRQFRWDAGRQSRLIESVILGIPVPPLFMATTPTEDQQTGWEVVDGLQRLLSLANFAGDSDTREALKLAQSALVLTGMEKLTTFNNCAFLDLPRDIQATLEDRPLKVVVLNDKSDTAVRFDLFERLNTGGVLLTPQEIRDCVYRGAFVDLLGELSATLDFKTVVRLTGTQSTDGTPADFVLRFFAYLENYEQFDHSVADFLNDFIANASIEPKIEARERVFKTTMAFLAQTFPSGIRLRRGVTSVNLYEGVAVGAALALQVQPGLSPAPDPEWLQSEELRKLTTGATNTKSRVFGRIHFCRDHFLGQL